MGWLLYSGASRGQDGSDGRTAARIGGGPLVSLLLEADLVANDFWKFLKDFLVLDQNAFDDIKIVFNAAEALSIFIQMRLGLNKQGDSAFVGTGTTRY